MSARRSARVRGKPPVSYYESEEEIEDVVTDIEEEADEEYDESDSDARSSLDHGTKKRKGEVLVSMLQRKRKIAKPPTFRWADLPGEIKNKIYDYALVKHDGPILISATHLSKSLTHSRRRAGHEGPLLAWSLLLLNKQTYSEAAPILYSANNFSFRCWRAMYMFLFPLGWQTKSWIRSVGLIQFAIHMQDWTMVALDALIGATNLQRLDVFICDEREFYKYAYRWLEAVGRQKGDKYAALDLIRSSYTIQGYNYDASKLKAMIK